MADFYAPELHEAGGPEAKAALERIAMGRRVEGVDRLTRHGVADPLLHLALRRPRSPPSTSGEPRPGTGEGSVGG